MFSETGKKDRSEGKHEAEELASAGMPRELLLAMLILATIVVSLLDKAHELAWKAGIASSGPF
jgi:hypothetical protein